MFRSDGESVGARPWRASGRSPRYHSLTDTRVGRRCVVIILQNVIIPCERFASRLTVTISDPQATAALIDADTSRALLRHVEIEAIGNESCISFPIGIFIADNCFFNDCRGIYLAFSLDLRMIRPLLFPD